MSNASSPYVLALAPDTLGRISRLNRGVLKQVGDFVKRFDELAAGAGAHIEPYKGSADPRARTARINDNFRAVMWNVREREYLLIDVLPHDHADRWMLRKKLDVDVPTGSIVIRDVRPADSEMPERDIGTSDAPPLIYAHRSEDDFTKLGFDLDDARRLKSIKSEDELLAEAELWTTVQQEAILLLADPELSLEEIDSQLKELLAEPAGETIAEAMNVEAAVDRAIADGNLLVADDELAELIETGDFQAWQVFLHPTQRGIAHRASWSGPVRITGGAGTGKTVTLLHRAHVLAKQLHDGGSQERVLVTTYTRNLAADLDRLLDQLVPDAQVRALIDVRNIDRVALDVLKLEGAAPQITDQAREEKIWASVVAGIRESLTNDFLADEYQNVVLAQGIQSRDEYFEADRAGRGAPLGRMQRGIAWTAFEAFEKQTAGRDRPTLLQLAGIAADRAASGDLPWRHVLVDEAQDLHAMHWRLLRASVAKDADDLFIAGDAHQRIYDRYVVLGRLGIDIRGRARRLRLNYRTTHEVLRWSLGVLRGAAIDDLDGGSDTLLGYRSELHGPAPLLVSAEDTAGESEQLVKLVTGWIEEGIPAQRIGVCARTSRVVKIAGDALRAAGVATSAIDTDGPASANGVRTGTMHRFKGLEFQAVAIFGCSARHLPCRPAVTPESEDPIRHRSDLLRERSLVYVAATRARERLAVTWNGEPSPLLPAVEGDA